MITGTRRWWRAAAVAVLSGGVAAGWFALGIPAQADPAQPPAPAKGKEEPAVWIRSNAPQMPPAAEAVPAVAVVPATPAFPVIPAAGALPAIPATPPAMIPALPGSIPDAPPATIPPLPTTPPTVGNPSVALPIPDPVPPTPASATGMLPIALPTNPKLELPPAMPAVPTLPTEPAIVPAAPMATPAIVPAAPIATPTLPGMPPAPLAPPMPVTPPFAPLTPLSPPVKSPEPVQPNPPTGSDFNLRPGDSGNNVKPAVPFAPAAPKVPQVPPPDVPTGPPMVPTLPTGSGAGNVPTTTVDRPKPADGPFGYSDKYVFPLPGGATAVPNTNPPVIPPPATPVGIRPMNDTLDPAPGDPTMRKKTALAAVIGGALGFAPAQPAAALPLPIPKKSTIADPTQDTRTADKKIEDLQKEVKRLTEMIEGKRDSDGFPIPGTGLRNEVNRLNDRIAALEKQVAAMEKSTSLRPTVPAAALKGTVRVVNEYPVLITILINTTTHRVEPGKSLDVEVPAGEFSYQLLQNGAAPTKSTIKDKEVVTLRIK